MATMNPVLRLRRVFRDMGAEEEQAEEAASTIDEEYVSRNFFEARMSQQTAELQAEIRASMAELRKDMAELRKDMAELRKDMAELRKDMAELRNQILLGTLLIAGIAVAVLSVVIAVFA